VTRAAIVLAGGASRRFGRDKLAEPVGGRPLLDLAIDAARAVTPTMVVVLAPGDERRLPADVRAVHDPVAHEGPLAGVLAGLAALASEVDAVVVLGGDMPTAVPAVLGALLDRLDDPAVAAAWLADEDGRPRPLPLALRAAPARARARTLLDGGDRRLRALPLALGAVVIDVASWRPLDPGGGTLRDVDVPADLPAD